jgi:SanA protein
MFKEKRPVPIVIHHFSPVIRWLITAVCGVFLLIVFCNALVFAVSNPHIFRRVEEMPKHATVIVLGARVYKNTHLSPMLADRMRTALDLYREGKADRFLLSGDHGTKEYDEVNAMKDFLLAEGVDAGDIFLDHAGFDTYDSMYRAREIFQADSVVVVTQSFHLPRAVYLARSLGLDAVGVSADRQAYAAVFHNNVREILSRVKACLDIAFHARPKYLGQAIPITGDALKSWDTKGETNLLPQ